MMQDPVLIVDWIFNEQKPDNIIVFDDLRTAFKIILKEHGIKHLRIVTCIMMKIIRLF